MKLTPTGKLLVAVAVATILLTVVSETAGLVAVGVLALVALGALGGLHGGSRRSAAEDVRLRQSFGRSVDRNFFING